MNTKHKYFFRDAQELEMEKGIEIDLRNNENYLLLSNSVCFFSIRITTL